MSLLEHTVGLRIPEAQPIAAQYHTIIALVRHGITDEDMGRDANLLLEGVYQNVDSVRRILSLINIPQNVTLVAEVGHTVLPRTENAAAAMFLELDHMGQVQHKPVRVIGWNEGSKIKYNEAPEIQGTNTIGPIKKHYEEHGLAIDRDELVPIWLNNEELAKEIGANPGDSVATSVEAYVAGIAATRQVRFITQKMRDEREDKNLIIEPALYAMACSDTTIGAFLWSRGVLDDKKIQTAHGNFILIGITPEGMMRTFLGNELIAEEPIPQNVYEAIAKVELDNHA